MNVLRFELLTKVLFMMASTESLTSNVEKQAVRSPNFLYIGTSKAGSTWIYDVLSAHSDVYIAPGKGTYFFSHHFDRGFAWYGEHFARAVSQKVVGEISHAYLYSSEAAERIAVTIPAAKLMVCLREPIERAFSAYLDVVKNGRFTGTFEESLDFDPEILGRGNYATALEPFLERFNRHQIHASVFDDLKANPQQFADEVFQFLEIDSYAILPKMRKKMMPAARPRWAFATRIAKQSARFLERIGLKQLRGQLKRTRWMRHALYQPYDKLPDIATQTKERLRNHFRDGVRRLDEMLSVNLSKRWGYT